jgi:homoserine O-succinyltransferase
MPDSAIEDTEAQFFMLLDGASKEIPVFLELISLPKIPRGERARQHLDAFYENTSALLGRRLDGLIVTGTEPRQSDLSQEPYWDALTEVLVWAEENTSSTVLSCLAAHAGVLFSDGISRRLMGEKRFGVFEHQMTSDHPVTRGLRNPVRIPHSRWNEVEETALVSAGYMVLTKSAEAGVDLFVKKKKRALFVHFQGHPEYTGNTPFKEYRRDVRRFLRGERDTYPGLPRNYFDLNTTNVLNAFRELALSCRHERLMESFPDASVTTALPAIWQSDSVQLYRNWLEYLKEQRVQLCLAHTSLKVDNSEKRVIQGRSF